MDEFDLDESRNADDLLIIRETVIDGRTFRLRAHRVTAGRLEISFESHDDQGRDVGHLASEIPVNDLLPVAKALGRLAQGAAVVLGPARSGAATATTYAATTPTPGAAGQPTATNASTTCTTRAYPSTRSATSSADAQEASAPDWKDSGSSTQTPPPTRTQKQTTRTNPAHREVEAAATNPA